MIKKVINPTMEENQPKVLKELKRGLLKKRNEFYLQQTRTFILTNEPKLRYYKNEEEYKVRLAFSFL